MNEILLPLDGSAPAAAALLPVARLARGLGSIITLLQVCSPPGVLRPLVGGLARPGGSYSTWEIAPNQTIGPLAAPARRLAAQGIAVRKIGLSGDPATALFAYSRQGTHTRIVALAVPGPQDARDWPLGRIAQHTLLAAPGWSLWTPVGAPAAPGDYRTILVPLDGSPLAELALAQAQELAAAAGATLILVNVLPPGTPAPAAADHTAYLATVAAATRAKGITVETVLPTGDAARILLTLAGATGADLLVMTTDGHRAQPHLSLGAVVGEIVTSAPVPVLLARPGAPILPGRVRVPPDAALTPVPEPAERQLVGAGA
ncbi:MAG TPA: universal stress protein [Chloroflexia bacterium]|nr:universal stress protein [Chloroflexia bacterium]